MNTIKVGEEYMCQWPNGERRVGRVMDRTSKRAIIEWLDAVGHPWENGGVDVFLCSEEVPLEWLLEVPSMPHV